MKHSSFPACLALSIAAAALAACEATPPASLTVITGSLPLYRTQGTRPRNDVSGAAFLPAEGKVLLVDDGGDPPQGAAPDVVPFYLVDPANNFQVSELRDAVMTSHGDLEAATQDGQYVYVASSMSGEYMDERVHTLSRFKLRGGVVSDVRTLRPRAGILDAVGSGFDGAWIERIKATRGREGGLNIEGLTYTPNPNQLIVGLRSPHADPRFPEMTRIGAALLLTLDVTLFTEESLAPTAFTLDLGGLGVRSMEYSPTARGYFILAGIVERGPDYDFFFWAGPGAAPVRIELPEFKGLCRPEAVTEIDLRGRKFLWVISEESGDICEEVKYNYLLVELNQAFLSRLR